MLALSYTLKAMVRNRHHHSEALESSGSNRWLLPEIHRWHDMPVGFRARVGFKSGDSATSEEDKGTMSTPKHSDIHIYMYIYTCDTYVYAYVCRLTVTTYVYLYTLYISTSTCVY